MAYASETTVSPEKSRAEIESTVKRYGATRWIYGEQEQLAVVGFELEARSIRFRLRLPDPTEERFHKRKRKGMKPLNLTELQSRRAFEQEVRRLWRALALSVKAKLEAVESGIAVLEEEFLANLVVRSKTGAATTVGEQFIPELQRAIAEGNAPRLELPGMGETGR